MLQILRPVHCAGVPTNSRVRAGAMLHVIYDDYVLCQDPGDALPHQQCDLGVLKWCLRLVAISR